MRDFRLPVALQLTSRRCRYFRGCLSSVVLLSAFPVTRKRNKIAMLIEQLKADDINLRVTATRSLPAIAEALGPERVRAELVPFVNDSTDDEDEVRWGKGGKGGEGRALQRALYHGWFAISIAGYIFQTCVTCIRVGGGQKHGGQALVCPVV